MASMQPEPENPPPFGVIVSPMSPWLHEIVLHALHESGAPLLATPQSCLVAMQQAATLHAGLLVAPLAALTPLPTLCLLQAPAGLTMLALNPEYPGIAAYELRLLTRNLGLAELTQVLGRCLPDPLSPPAR